MTEELVEDRLEEKRLARPVQVGLARARGKAAASHFAKEWAQQPDFARAEPPALEREMTLIERRQGITVLDYEYKRFASAIRTADNMRPAKGRAPGDVRVSRAIRSSPLLRVRAADSHLVPQHLDEQFVAIGIPRFHDDASLARTRSCRLAVRPRHSRTAGNVLQPGDCKDISRMGGGRSADRVTFLLQNRIIPIYNLPPFQPIWPSRVRLPVQLRHRPTTRRSSRRIHVRAGD